MVAFKAYFVKTMYKTTPVLHVRKKIYTHKKTYGTAKTPILYGDMVSPPVRFVLMTASILKTPLKFHEIDLFASENKTEFYKKINVLQKVPALDTGDEVIWDSHAIAMYLCQTKGSEQIYPQDTLSQAKVNQMMFYNAGTIFPVDSEIYTQFFGGKKNISEEQMKAWNMCLAFLEHQLIKHQCLSGEKKQLTWAHEEIVIRLKFYSAYLRMKPCTSTRFTSQMMLSDICCAATVTSLSLLVPIPENYVKVKTWIKKLEEHPCFQININGLKRLQVFIDMCNTI